MSSRPTRTAAQSARRGKDCQQLVYFHNRNGQLLLSAIIDVVESLACSVTDCSDSNSYARQQ